jgi:PhnB protein
MPMPAKTSDRTKDEAEIRGVIDAWARALRRKDADAVVAQHAPDFVHFSLAPPLVTVPDTANLEAWFATWDGPIGYELHDLRITVGTDVAFSTSLNRMTGTKTDGAKPDLWFRHTLGFRKLGGAWKMAHEHESVPFYMDGSVRAAVDLEP